MSLQLLDLPYELIYCIADELTLPELLYFALTCKLLFEIIMCENYRDREKTIFQLDDLFLDKVSYAAQANEIGLLQYYRERLPANTSFIDFWDSTGRGAAMGGHIALIRESIDENNMSRSSMMFSLAIMFKHNILIDYFCQRQIKFSDECTQSIVLTGNINLFIHMVAHGHMVPVRDFPIVCVEGSRGIVHQSYIMLGLILNRVPADFMSTFADSYLSENNEEEYYDILAFCLTGPELVMQKILTIGFNDWNSAVAAGIKCKNSKLVKKALELVEGSDNLRDAIKIGILQDNVYGLKLIIDKFPTLKEIILAKCEKYNKPDTTRLLLYANDLF